MTIEFHCPYCQKLLKTADDKAGVRANCPGCGEPITVPSPGGEVTEHDPSLVAAEHAPEPASAEDLPSDSAAPGEPARDSASVGQMKNCPMCGELIKAAATRCRFCGESLVERPSGAPTVIEAGDVLSRTWELFQQKMGLLIGATLVLMGIGLVIFVAMYAVQVAVMLSFVRPGMAGRPNPVTIVAAVYGPMGVFILLYAAVNSFLEGGYHLLLCRIARGEPAQLGDLFSGGRYFWRVFVSNLVFMIAIYIGFFLLIAPAIFLALAFWPFLYVIVDQDVGVIESFRRSRELTTGNYLAIFVLGLAAAGAWIAGSMACYIGLIFTTPFTLLLFAVAYCMMSGQIAPRSPAA